MKNKEKLLELEARLVSLERKYKALDGRLELYRDDFVRQLKDHREALDHRQGTQSYRPTVPVEK